MKHPKIVAAAAVLSVVAIFVGLGFVPVTRHFEMHGVAVQDPRTGCPGGIIVPVEGTTFSFHWWAPAYTVFAVLPCPDGPVVYESIGTNGSGSLVATGVAYMFGALCTAVCVPANVSGEYTSYLLDF